MEGDASKLFSLVSPYCLIIFIKVFDIFFIDDVLVLVTCDLGVSYEKIFRVKVQGCHHSMY